MILSFAARRRPNRWTLVAGVVAWMLSPAAAHADRRYFPLTYTPYLSPAGESEVELWLTSRSGKQDPGQGVHLESRAELEHALSSRLTAAAYLNYAHRPASGSRSLAARSGALSGGDGVRR